MKTLDKTHLPLKNVPIRVANGSHVPLYHHRRGGVHLLVMATDSDENKTAGREAQSRIKTRVRFPGYKCRNICSGRTTQSCGIQ